MNSGIPAKGQQQYIMSNVGSNLSQGAYMIMTINCYKTSKKELTKIQTLL